MVQKISSGQRCGYKKYDRAYDEDNTATTPRPYYLVHLEGICMAFAGLHWHTEASRSLEVSKQHCMDKLSSLSSRLQNVNIESANLEYNIIIVINFKRMYVEDYLIFDIICFDLSSMLLSF